MRIKIPVVCFLVLVVLSAIVAYSVNTFNLNFLKEQNTEIFFNQTIKTADDKSYLSPVNTFIETGVWKEDQEGKGSYYKRSPGYGLFLLPHFIVFEKTKALFFIKISQCFLHGLLAGGLFLSFLYFNINQKLALVFAGFFGFFPLFYGYVFYTLTEGITAFILFLLFFIYLAKPFKKHLFNFIAVCLVFSYLIITRPVLGLFILIPFGIWYKFNFHFKYSLGFIGIILCILPYSIWMKRNAEISEESLNLHPIYDSGNKTVWRLPHQAIYELVKLYNPQPSDYHTWNKKLWTAAQQKIHFNEIDDAMSIFNQQSIQLIGEDSLSYFTELYFNTLIEVPAFATREKFSMDEKKVSAAFIKFSKNYSTTFWIESNIITPHSVMKQIICTSSLNLQCFWKNNGGLFITLLRYTSAVINIFIFIIPFLGFIIDWKFLKKYWAVFIGISAYLFYLIYFQRGIENRYVYPLFPLLYCLTVILLYKQYLKLFKSRNTSNISSSN